MRGFKRTWGWLFLTSMALIVAGCASIDPQAVQSQTRGKTIAVASALGPELNLTWVGTTIFNNQFGTRPVPDWRIDEQVAIYVSQSLTSGQRYAAVNVLQGVSRKGNTVPVLPAGTTADFLLLIEQYDADDPIWNTNQSFKGLGIAQRTFMGLAPPAHGHVGVTIELFDMLKGASVGRSSEFENWPINFRLSSGGTASLTTSPAPLVKDSDLETLREPMLDRLRATLEKLLGEMGLR